MADEDSPDSKTPESVQYRTGPSRLYEKYVFRDPSGAFRSSQEMSHIASEYGKALSRVGLDRISYLNALDFVAGHISEQSKPILGPSGEVLYTTTQSALCGFEPSEDLLTAKVLEILAAVTLAHARVQKDQEEVDQLKTETRETLRSLRLGVRS